MAAADKQTVRGGTPARRPRAAAPQRRVPRPGAQLLQPRNSVRAYGGRAVAVAVLAPAAVLRGAARRSAGAARGPAAAGGRREDGRRAAGRAPVEVLPCRFVCMGSGLGRGCGNKVTQQWQMAKVRILITAESMDS